MKYCFYKRRLQLTSLAKTRTLRRLARKQRKKALRKEHIGYQKILMPKIFNIAVLEWRTLLLKAIIKMHDLLKNGKRKIIFNFSDTKQIISSAMLLFYAEIKNASTVYKNIKFKYVKPHSPKTAQVLTQLGLANLFHEKRCVRPCDADVVHWRATSGTDSSGQLYENVINQSDPLPKEVDLYGGFIEAINNCHEHAYIEPREISDVNTDKARWWAFSQIKDGYLTVAVCDLGIGIPKTIPIRNKVMDRFIRLFRKAEDVDYILTTITGPKSRTGKVFRGNGLPRIAEVAKTVPKSYLVIYSNNGYVQISAPDKGQEQKTKQINFPQQSIHGTIIEWMIPILEECHERDNYST